MNPLEQLSLIFGEVKKHDIVENFERFRAVYELRSPTPSEQDFKSLYSILDKLNRFNIQVLLTLKIDSYNPIRLNSKNQENFTERLQEYNDNKKFLKEDDSFELIVEIDKSDHRNLNIFCFKSFFSNNDDIDLKSMLIQWSKCLSEKTNTILLWDEASVFSTKNLNFIHYSSVEDPESTVKSKKLRSKRILLRDKCCHFANAAELNLIPEDFMVNGNVETDEILRTFKLLSTALSICFISDHSTISSNGLGYRLNGYKVISETLNIDQLLDVNKNEITEIYEWIYSGGDISDRIGISRNIISIHTNDDCFLGLQSGTTKSIRSGYELYLKENVKQYIEIKNKISDFLHAQSDKASDLTKNMFSMFKANIWTFSTFFVGVFLLRALNKNPEGTAFNLEVLLVSYLLLAVSFIYLAISTSELNSDRDRILHRYDTIKQRYKELLDPKDLDTIIDSDDLKKKDRLYINSKRNKYIFAWSSINFILGVFVTCLYLSGFSKEVGSVPKFDLPLRTEILQNENYANPAKSVQGPQATESAIPGNDRIKTEPEPSEREAQSPDDLETRGQKKAP